jgi:hypothetical protein
MEKTRACHATLIFEVHGRGSKEQDLICMLRRLQAPVMDARYVSAPSEARLPYSSHLRSHAESILRV